VNAPAHCGRRLFALAASLAVSAAVFTACDYIPTDPSAVFSMSLDTVPSPSVVAGDSMRDTTGVVVALSGQAYNVKGQLLTNVPVQFASLTLSQLRITSSNIAIGTPTGDSIARVVANAQSLQSLPFFIPVVLRPDSIEYADTNSVQTVTLSLTNADSNISQPLTIFLKHIPDSLGGDSVTRTYIVHYQITYPASAAKGTGTVTDTSLFAYLADLSGNPARTDTTDAGGLGQRERGFAVAKVPPNANDSIVAVATAFYRKTPVGNSPLTFIVHYTGPSFSSAVDRSSVVSRCSRPACHGKR
jgi:hypothetical protein